MDFPQRERKSCLNAGKKKALNKTARANSCELKKLDRKAQKGYYSYLLTKFSSIRTIPSVLEFHQFNPFWESWTVTTGLELSFSRLTMPRKFNKIEN